jgi:hypothetical protein
MLVPDRFRYKMYISDRNQTSKTADGSWFQVWGSSAAHLGVGFDISDDGTCCGSALVISRSVPGPSGAASGRGPAAIIDSQSVKGSEMIARTRRGYDAGKKINSQAACGR